MLKVLKDAVEGNIPFWILTFTSLFLLIGAVFTPPRFVIDSSIIAAVGELAGFGALWCVVKGIDNGITTKAKTKSGTEISVEHPRDEQTRGP